MKLTGRVPVEPLSEERLTRIERHVVTGAASAVGRGQGSRAPRRHLGRALAASAIVAAGVAGWVLHGAPASGPVVAEPAPVRVETEPARTRLDLGDARIESDPATVFAVTRPAGGVLVEVTRGKVELDVDNRGARPPLIVRAGQTDVIVVGTHFTVDYGDGQGEVSVRVTEGVVRVVHQQRETRVAAGQAWQTRAGLVASAKRDARRAEAALPQVLGDGKPVAAGSREAAVGRVGTVGTVRAVRAGGALDPSPDVLRGRKAVAPSTSGAPAALPPRNATNATNATAPIRPASGHVRQHARPRPNDPQADLRSAVAGQHVEAALDLAEPDPRRAVATYFDIAAHKSGEEASQAFYSIAVVRHLRLARDADALQMLDAYIRRFPGGKQYRAVLWLRVRILCLEKIDDRCRAAAYTYLHEAPDAPAARVAELLTLSE